jgi:hypothetical protein
VCGLACACDACSVLCRSVHVEFVQVGCAPRCEFQCRPQVCKAPYGADEVLCETFRLGSVWRDMSGRSCCRGVARGRRVVVGSEHRVWMADAAACSSRRLGKPATLCTWVVPVVVSIPSPLLLVLLVTRACTCGGLLRVVVASVYRQATGTLPCWEGAACSDNAHYM